MPLSWWRAVATRTGIRRPFSGVVCVSGQKTISLEADGRGRIRTTRTFVFLEPPGPEDLEDTYTTSPEEASDLVHWESSDALEVKRERRNAARVTVCWRPYDPIPLYSLYRHENEWRPANVFEGPAVFAEHECDMRTGVFTIELLSARPFEAAVVFKRPRWPSLRTKRSIIRHTLRCLKDQRYAPRLSTDGMTVGCEFRNPRVGDRYVIVAIRKCGVTDLEDELWRTSIAGRARQLIGRTGRRIAVLVNGSTQERTSLSKNTG